MPFFTVDLPERFASAVRVGHAAEVADAEVDNAAEHFARAVARSEIGRYAEARADLERVADLEADEELVTACRLELAYLDLVTGRALRPAVRAASDLAADSDRSPRLRARAWHLIGLGEGKLRRWSVAFDALQTSCRLYESLDQRASVARVRDTMAALETSCGRLDSALHYYALSLVDKALDDDRAGMATTLGSIGRVQLRAGRFEQAVECFERDLELSEQLEDRRGIVRMNEDLGRAFLALERFDVARRHLGAALASARKWHFGDLEFLACVDLARLALAEDQLDEADASYQAAAAALPRDAEPLFSALLTELEGELLIARGDAGAIELLRSAVEAFCAGDAPDLEIPARVALAKAYRAARLPALAEEALVVAARRAKQGGFRRFSRQLSEAMASLDVVEGLLAETDRHLATADESAPRSPHDYVLREKLGGGAFGEVFRAYDPVRGQEVAYKRLRLSQLYETRRRAKVIASARRELEAASRVRHPGVARVLAIGGDPSDEMYVVQEFVPGRSLRDLIPFDASAPLASVLKGLAEIAEALTALHAAGTVHRDLKPGNVIARAEGSLVLVDFGIAAVAGLRSAVDESVLGTLPYMSPEQARGRQLDGRSDLYSLGVIAFEWLTGTRPIDPRGENWSERVDDLLSKQPLRLRDLRRGLPADLESLVSSLLDRAPRRRPTAAEVAQRCCRMSEDLGV